MFYKKFFNYDDNSKKKFFEGGAHFKYTQLYKKLEQLSKNEKIKINRRKLVESRSKRMKEKLEKENNNKPTYLSLSKKKLLNTRNISIKKNVRKM